MNKFSGIKNLKRTKLRDLIPDFRVLNLNSETRPPHQDQESHFGFPVIVRSCLHGEGNHKLLSGLSLSRYQIEDSAQLEAAIAECLEQENLDEIIIQKYIPYSSHWTIFFHDQLIFGESKTSQFFVGSKYFLQGDLIHFDILKRTIDSIQKTLDLNSFLIEVGIETTEKSDSENKSRCWVFQVSPIAPEIVHKVFSNQVLLELVKQRNKQARRTGLIDFLKSEWDHRKLRLRLEKLDKSALVSDQALEIALNNWVALFDYFFYYCKLNRLPGTDQSFTQFLSAIQTKKTRWPLPLAKRHLYFAQEMASYETFRAPASFISAGTKAYFLGNGKIQVAKNEAKFIGNINDLSIAKSYSWKVVFTRSNSLLSHPILSLVEANVPVVANLSENTWDELQMAKTLDIDMDTGSIGQDRGLNN